MASTPSVRFWLWFYIHPQWAKQMSVRALFNMVRDQLIPIQALYSMFRIWEEAQCPYLTLNQACEELTRKLMKSALYTRVYETVVQLNFYHAYDRACYRDNALQMQKNVKKPTSEEEQIFLVAFMQPHWIYLQLFYISLDSMSCFFQIDQIVGEHHTFQYIPYCLLAWSERERCRYVHEPPRLYPSFTSLNLPQLFQQTDFIHERATQTFLASELLSTKLFSWDDTLTVTACYHHLAGVSPTQRQRYLVRLLDRQYNHWKTQSSVCKYWESARGFVVRVNHSADRFDEIVVTTTDEPETFYRLTGYDHIAHVQAKNLFAVLEMIMQNPVEQWNWETALRTATDFELFTDAYPPTQNEWAAGMVVHGLAQSINPSLAHSAIPPEFRALYAMAATTLHEIVTKQSAYREFCRQWHQAETAFRRRLDQPASPIVPPASQPPSPLMNGSLLVVEPQSHMDVWAYQPGKNTPCMFDTALELVQKWLHGRGVSDRQMGQFLGKWTGGGIGQIGQMYLDALSIKQID